MPNPTAESPPIAAHHPSSADSGPDERPAHGAEAGRHHLSFEGLRRSFGRVRALRDVSGAADQGELLLVTGANGSGKSTLLRCLAGLLRPQKGTICCRVDGRELGLDERRHAVGFLSPDLAFYEELGTLENLRFFARLRGVSAEGGGALLERLGLPQKRAAGALSSGMRQRLRWAWALLHAPRILLLDEPMQNLDAAGRRDVAQLLAGHLEGGDGRGPGLAVVANPDPVDLPRVDHHVELAG
ncbi:MAG: ABC transporter ATP-binding protein [Holophagales bacterium]|nr:ABC transporter ATP-binding protein [Holophagales bacterium]